MVYKKILSSLFIAAAMFIGVVEGEFSGLKSNNLITAMTSTDEKDLPEIEKLLKDKEVNVNYNSSADWTPLTRAVANNNEKGVQLLLKHPKIKVNQPRGDSYKETPLYIAVRALQPKIVEALMAHQEIDPNVASNEGLSGVKPVPLMTLMRDKNYQKDKAVEVFNILSGNKKTNLMARDEHGSTLLMSLLGVHSDERKQGWKPFVEAVVKAGGKELVNAKDKYGSTALMEYLGKLGAEKAIVQLLIDNGADVDQQALEIAKKKSLNAQGNNIVELLESEMKKKTGETTTLIKELNEGEKKLFEELGKGKNASKSTIEDILSKHKDIDIDARGSMGSHHGTTPLIGFVTRDKVSPDIVKLLLDHGADRTLTWSDNYGIYTALKMAELTQDDDVKNVLKNYIPKKPVTQKSYTIEDLFAEIKENPDIKKLQEILQTSGIGVNDYDSTGATPLYYAAGYKNKELIKLLLGVNGIEVNKKHRDTQKTPLMRAVEAGNVDAVEALLAKKALANETDKNARTALMYLFDECKMPMNDMVKIFIFLAQKGADMNMQNNMGHTALISALALHSKDCKLTGIIGSMINDREAKVNLKNKNDLTPLMMFVQDPANKERVLLLLEHGADISIKTVSGKTALDFARMVPNNTEIVQIIEEHAKKLEEKKAPEKKEEPKQPQTTTKPEEKKEAKVEEKKFDVYSLFNELRKGQYANKELIEKMMGDSNVDINGKDSNSRPVIVAINNNVSDDILETLLQHPQLDINMPISISELDTPLHAAVIRNNENHVQLLLKYGADVSIKNKSGKTALDLVEGFYSPNKNIIGILKNEIERRARAVNNFASALHGAR